MAVFSRYKNVIWTNHILERLSDRNINQDSVWKTYRYPDETAPGKTAGTTEFIKRIGTRTFTVIATRNEKKEWILLSCWVQPPFPGSIDVQKKKAYLQYKHSSLGGKIWIRLKQVLGLYQSF